MSTVGSGGPLPAPAAGDTSSSHWAPHGAVLTACVVGINVLVILIFFFFWRFFVGKRGTSSSAPGGGGTDDDGVSLPVASPFASSRRRYGDALGAQAQAPLGLGDDVVAALPVYVYSGAGEGGKAAECAVCIVELRDGDAARLLPPCGHRFHADCVSAWLRLHATCPLCRASVVAPAAAAAAGTTNAKDDDAGAEDCPV